MKRFHVHVHVKDLTESIGFYSNLFGRSPARREPDYAKWMLDDPRVNFAISTGSDSLGVDHLGVLQLPLDQMKDDELQAALTAMAHS